ncbi:uncharacterized protein EKO05_0010821 [Ascochyta rabiei]|uniref:GTPase n=1 Tax=Didymella rabiei TaxID=5454 RepID=A0A163F5R7_DIDRA|nr:uncharacterized protein EKO05_0010821 [Ascochyta rabiei]KZM24164.1 GTPase [Ascochyta rabiei]UPX20593.1 hypothetical protein EKO05_0010821 [Ascochyta rabiei]
MAGPTQRRGRDAFTKTPSLTSDDGTLTDTPLADKSVDGDLAQPAQVLEREPMQDASVSDEVGPLGANVIEALRIVGKLEQLGLDKQEISLPKCIVLGQQSTGKSSVIEAISGIKTPRDTGTCTRTPLFIELQPAADPHSGWHAEIHLLRQYDILMDPCQDGQDIEFPGWIPTATPARTAFAQTDDPGRLEHLIRCAQRATLSPFQNPGSFLDPTFDDRGIHKTLFSPNIVCIAVSKPGLPPLSFYDLPGMIGQAETEEEEFTVPLVERLVTKFIKDPEALVLVTCALENDIANSIAAGLARKLKVTDRCMGVLTKPDRLPQGSSSGDLASVLENRRFQLGHRYFVVKNLDSDEIQQGLTHQDARRLEREFFATVAPWSTDLQPYQSRFGTVNMQQYLSTELGNRVLSKLPVIRRQIEARLATVEDELSRIPDTPLHTAARTVADIVQAFANEMRSEMAGDHGSMTWSNAWEEIQQTFWDMMLELKPTMSIRGKLDEGLFLTTLLGRSADECIVLDSDDDVETSDLPETPSKKRKHDARPKRELQTPAHTPLPSRTPRAPASRTSRQLFPNASPSNRSNDMTRLRKQFKLDDVTRHISQHSKSRVPGQMNPKVREDMMLSALAHWPRVVSEFFKELEHQLKLRVKVLFDRHFSAWKGSGLYAKSLAIVESLLDSNIHEQRTTMAAESLIDERDGPHIFHKDIFKKDKAAVMDRYRQARADARFKVFVNEAEAHYEKTYTPADKEKIRKDDRKMALIKEEPYTHEVDLVADISTYYMIAARRFHDSVTMRIESKFFKQLREKLRDQLQDELGIYDEHEGPYNAQRLLAESAERLARRNALVAKKKALLEGLQCFSDHLQQFEANHGSMPAGGSFSNYQRPSVSTAPADEMDGVSGNGLPIR